MPSSFYGLNIATSGMYTYNAGLTTTGHNIANAKTQGYSRQEVLQQAKEPLALGTSYGMLGSGVEAYDVVSSRDSYYDYKYRKSNSIYGKYETSAHYMKSVEEALYAVDKDSGGISNSLDQLFQNLSSLTTNVSDSTIRTQVTGNADSVMSYVQEVAAGLQASQLEVNSQIDSTVDKINSFAKQIASLNKQINTLELYGSKANDLRDQRARAIDELSNLVDVEVTEQPPKDGNGLNQFLVFVGDSVLVDTNTFNQINIVTRTTKENQTDNEGLYDLKWSTGQEFNIRNANIGGSLQALLEVRDGNNEENFHATLNAFQQADGNHDGKSTITLVTDAKSSVNASNLSKLNIPESDGKIEISNFSYQYDSFDVEVAADGTYKYTFVLKDELGNGDLSHLQTALNTYQTKYDKTSASVGDPIAFRGIPYYLAQLTEFTRVFSANFNEVQNTGYDLNGNPGQDLFVTQNVASGEEHGMTEFLYHKDDGYYYIDGCRVMTGDLQTEYTAKGYTFEPIDGKDGFFTVKDENKQKVEEVYIPESEKKIFSFSSTLSAGEKTSYYHMTALTGIVSKELLGDSNLLACKSQAGSGVSESGNLNRMLALKDDKNMFKQGPPFSFLSVVVATAGVDEAKLTDSEKNSLNIVNAVDNRRLSKSGVDEDEEGQNLIQYQNLLKYQYQVISVMNEVLDKLINGTGV